VTLRLTSALSQILAKVIRVVYSDDGRHVHEYVPAEDLHVRRRTPTMRLQQASAKMETTSRATNPMEVDHFHHDREHN
jgi:hypothetical protein